MPPTPFNTEGGNKKLDTFYILTDFSFYQLIALRLQREKGRLERFPGILVSGVTLEESGGEFLETIFRQIFRRAHSGTGRNGQHHLVLVALLDGNILRAKFEILNTRN